jgi:hypothetical protein
MMCSEEGILYRHITPSSALHAGQPGLTPKQTSGPTGLSSPAQAPFHPALRADGHG